MSLMLPGAHIDPTIFQVGAVVFTKLALHLEMGILHQVQSANFKQTFADGARPNMTGLTIERRDRVFGKVIIPFSDF